MDTQPLLREAACRSGHDTRPPTRNVEHASCRILPALENLECSRPWMDGTRLKSSRLSSSTSSSHELPHSSRPTGHAPQVTPHRSRPKLSSGRALAMPRRPRGSRQQRPASSSRQRPGGAARSAFPFYCRRTRHRGRPHARGLRATIHPLRSIHPLSSALWRVLRTAPPHARATAQTRTTQPHGRPRMSVRLVAGHV